MIVIKPEDLGINGIAAYFCGSHTLKASNIFEEMDEYQKEHQALGLAV